MTVYQCKNCWDEFEDGWRVKVGYMDTDSGSEKWIYLSPVEFPEVHTVTDDVCPEHSMGDVKDLISYAMRLD